MRLALDRQNLPQTILATLPFLLFLPIGVIYAGVGVFLLAWLYSGAFADKWHHARSSPLFAPILVLLFIVFVEAIFLSGENLGRWAALGHYLLFPFLLLFLSVGGGTWQQQAKKIFFAGATFGASLFYLAQLDLLSGIPFLHNYTVYSGNKSISLGIFLAIAAAWLLSDILAQFSSRKKFLQFALYAYLSIAVIFLAVTRTGMLLLFLLSLVAILHRLSMSWRGRLFVILGATLTIFVAWQISPVLKSRTLATAEALQIFAKGELATGQGNRLQFVKFTSEMIMEKPLLGHGLGGWVQQYPIRAQGYETSGMTTPHNDYLLYAAEMGAIGLFALLAIYGTLLFTARKLSSEHSIGLTLVSVAIILSSMFNAVLRDWKFGMPMMLLLAISLAGVHSKKNNRQPTNTVNTN